MRLKQPDQTPYTGWVFYFESKNTGKTIEVRAANGVAQLTDKARAVMRNNGNKIPANLKEIVEHQLCLRQPNPNKDCWSGGIGDTLHNEWIKPFLKSVELKASKLGAIGKAVASVAKKISGCGGCGGRKVHKDGKNSLGRAGVLNKILPSQRQ